MADTPTSTGKSQFGFLGQKVGPLPLWLWIAGGIGAWYFISKKGGSLFGLGSSGSAAPAATTSSTTYGTDPAGNVGYIDPESGYVYGSAEDIASLQQQGNVAGNTLASSGTSGTGQTFSNNQAWGQAAESYLVSVGDDPTAVSQAITLYLASQALTSQQQAYINLAISIIGPPPDLPGPAQVSTSSTVPPATTPTTGTCPSGYTYSSTQTGAPGEIAATGGTGWCELNQQTTPPPTNTAPPPTPQPTPVQGDYNPIPAGAQIVNGGILVNGTFYPGNVSGNTIQYASSTYANPNTPGYVPGFEQDWQEYTGNTPTIG